VEEVGLPRRRAKTKTITLAVSRRYSNGHVSVNYQDRASIQQVESD